MAGTVSSEGTESSGVKQFVYVVISAAILIWAVSLLADLFFEPEELPVPAYYIEVPGGPSMAERLQPEVDLKAIQRSWPISSADRVKLEAYMARLRKGEIVIAAAPANATAAPVKRAPKVVLDLGTLMASADADAGKKVARKCISCHSFDEGGRNAVGPNLYGVVGSQKARLTNFNYSGAMQAAGGDWSFESLNEYLRKPSKYIKGTRMAFAGIRKDVDRANLLAYMRSLSGSPAALPVPAPAPVEEAVSEAPEKAAEPATEAP